MIIKAAGPKFGMKSMDDAHFLFIFFTNSGMFKYQTCASNSCRINMIVARIPPIQIKGKTTEFK